VWDVKPYYVVASLAKQPSPASLHSFSTNPLHSETTVGVNIPGGS